MVYRIHTEAGAVHFEGLLDRAAMAGLAARCREASARTLRLRGGTDIEPECVEPLLALGLEIVPESPYLARWLERARRHGGQP